MRRAQWRISLYVVLLLSVTVPAAASLPFADGFENITVGDYPDENGWQVMFSGVSAYVTNIAAHTGDNSFRLESQSGWARHDYIQLSEIPDRISYEAAVCIAPTGQQEATVGFLTAHGSQGPAWNMIRIYGALGEVRFYGTDMTVVGEYTPGTWCLVRVDLDYTTLTADAWLNGTKVAEGLDIYPKEFESGYGPVVLDKFGLVSGGSGTVAYFDDIVVEATPTATVGVVAFESDRSGNLDIWAMWSDGTHVTQITTDPARDSEPAWSPDGKKIAFSSHRAGSGDIWVIDAETRDLWQITSDSVDEIAATWSPDGARIAYWHDYTSVRIVDVSDLDNPGTPTLLTEKHAMGPDWCVNGYVAFQSNHGHWGVYSIWAKNPDTGHEYEVVQYVGGAGAYDPAWSPDGLELAYANLQTGSASSHNEDIFVSPKDGPLPNLGEQVTSDSVIGNTGTGDTNPDWSSSGKGIYFTRFVHGSPIGEADIWVVNRDGTGLTNVTNRPEGRDSWPSVTSLIEYECLSVEIDIKPGSEPNPVNPKSRGVVPVAVFSSESFDATDIDPSTVLLAGAPVAQKPHDGRYMAHEQDVDGNGLTDLMLHFDTEGMDEAELATGSATLTGSTYGDICFEGQDNVTIVPHDIANDHWAVEYIAACMNADTVYGYPDGAYRPTREVGRDQMAAYVSRAAAGGGGSVPDPVADPTFPDVPDDHWAYSYIEYVVSAEIVEGYPDGEYKPAEVVTRDQMAVYIARARGWLGIEAPLDTAPEVFPDVPAGHWAGEAIAACLDHGVVKGYGDGSYLPNAAVSRDQMAAYISRAFELLN
jgi:hypothetical protein